MVEPAQQMHPEAPRPPITWGSGTLPAISRVSARPQAVLIHPVERLAPAPAPNVGFQRRADGSQLNIAVLPGSW